MAGQPAGRDCETGELSGRTVRKWERSPCEFGLPLAHQCRVRTCHGK